MKSKEERIKKKIKELGQRLSLLAFEDIGHVSITATTPKDVLWMIQSFVCKAYETDDDGFADIMKTIGAKAMQHGTQKTFDEFFKASGEHQFDAPPFMKPFMFLVIDHVVKQQDRIKKVYEEEMAKIKKEAE